DDGGGGHLVEAGEEGEVEVADVERPAVPRRDADGKALEGILDPDAVLGGDRDEADGEGYGGLVGLAAQARGHGGQVAFEEQGVELEVEFVEKLVLPPAVDVVAREGAFVVDRADEGVDSLGGGQVEVEVEIEAGVYL